MAGRAVAMEKNVAELPSKPGTESVQLAVDGNVDTEQIAVLAYECWQRRGCPIGSPEVDWFQAEEELKRRAEPKVTAA